MGVKRLFFLAAAVAVLCCAQEPEDVVAYWPFEETAADQAADATGRGHALHLEGVERVKGAIGMALRFAGASSSVQTPLTDDLQSPDQVSVEAWIRPDEAPAGAEGLGIVYAGNYLVRITRGNPSFHVFTTQWGPVLADGAVRAGSWYHLVGTYDGRQMCIYVNGKLSGTTPRQGAIARCDRPLILGRQANPFTGVIDEVRIHLRALSEPQVADLFAARVERLSPGIAPGRLKQPHEDFFGESRTSPAPIPTLTHLPPADLCFAVITDTHIGAKGEENQYCHTWRVEEAIRQINALKPAFVVNCGDIITTFPYADSFRQQCLNAVDVHKGFLPPVHFVPGNHDVGNQRTMRIWDEAWSKRSGKPADAMLFNEDYRKLYREHFGPDYYSFEEAGCKFVVINDEMCNSGTAEEEKQMQWLERELEAASDAKLVFAFAHHPLFWNRLDEPGPQNYEPVMQPARERLLDLFATHGTDALYTGHTHFGFANTYRGVRLRTIDSTTFNRTFPGVAPKLPGPARIFDPYQLGFLVVRVRDSQFHESWVPTYWRTPTPPEALAGRLGPRLIGRPASEVQHGLLGVRVQVPKTFTTPGGGREGVNDHWWRTPEGIGATWLQVWPPAGASEDWEDLRRALTLGRPRAVKVAVPLPSHPKAMAAVWPRLAPYAQAIDAAVVCNGLPMNPSAPLASWRFVGERDEWVSACARARSLVSAGTKVVLARFPLLGPDALGRIAAIAAAAKGKADVLSVWVSGEDAPEQAVEPALRQARDAASSAGLALWLDADGWQQTPEPRRSANFLRLLAVCHTLGVRMTWWGGLEADGGLLDQHLDPTPMFHAAQAWQSLVDAPHGAVTLDTQGRARVIKWRDAAGRAYAAWWRPDQDVETIGDIELDVPAGALLADPLHARLLNSAPNGRLPLCAWPLLARWPAGGAGAPRR